VKRSSSYHNLSDYTDDDYNKKIDINMNSGEYYETNTKPFPSISNEYLDDNNYQYLPHSPSNTNNSSAQLLLAQQKQRLNTVQFEDDRKNRQMQNDVYPINKYYDLNTKNNIRSIIDRSSIP
jgi:hypothetical protein